MLFSKLGLSASVDVANTCTSLRHRSVYLPPSYTVATFSSTARIGPTGCAIVSSCQPSVSVSVAFTSRFDGRSRTTTSFARALAANSALDFW